MAGSRALLGRVLLLSAVTMAILAGLAWTGVLPVPSDAQATVAAILTGVAVIDAVMGVRFVRDGTDGS